MGLDDKAPGEHSAHGLPPLCVVDNQVGEAYLSPRLEAVVSFGPLLGRFDRDEHPSKMAAASAISGGSRCQKPATHEWFPMALKKL
jgi:hypothetical protein